MNRIHFLALAGAAVLAACGDSNAPRQQGAPQQLSVSFTTGAAASASAAVRPSLAIAVASASSSIVISRAQVVLDEVELTQNVPGCMSDDSGTDDAAAIAVEARHGGGEVEHETEIETEHANDGCGAEVEAGPVLVDLPVNGGVATPVSVTVPAGTYRKLEYRMRAARAGEHDGTAFLAAHPEMQGVSVRVEGTVDGVPFVYTSAAMAKVELHLNPVVTVDASGFNLTIAVDVGSWFLSPAGGAIDPRSTDVTARAQVEANIRQSFHGFRDRDRDGRDDDHGDDDHGAGHR